MSVTNPVPEYRIIAPNESIISWKNNSITQQMLEIVSAEEIECGIRIGSGETLGDNVIQNTARAVGYIEGLGFLRQLLELTMIVNKEEDDNDGKKDS